MPSAPVGDPTTHVAGPGPAAGADGVASRQVTVARPRKSWWVALVAVGVVAAVAVGIVAAQTKQSADAPEPARAVSSTSVVDESSSHPPDPTVQPDRQATPSTTPSPTTLSRDEAYAALEEQVAADRSLNPVRGQWVAIIDSKYEGLYDPLIQDQPFTVPQILARYKENRANPEWGMMVRLLHNGDWGKKGNYKFMWVTIIDLDAPSKATVESWCATNFLGPAEDPEHDCMPRQMRIPY